MIMDVRKQETKDVGMLNDLQLTKDLRDKGGRKASSRLHNLSTPSCISISFTTSLFRASQYGSHTILSPKARPTWNLQGCPATQQQRQSILKFVFHWVTPILKVGYSRPLEEDGM